MYNKYIQWGQSYLPYLLLLMSTIVFVVTVINLSISMKEFLIYAQYRYSTNLKFIKGSKKEKLEEYFFFDYRVRHHLLKKIFLISVKLSSRPLF